MKINIKIKEDYENYNHQLQKAKKNNRITKEKAIPIK